MNRVVFVKRDLKTSATGVTKPSVKANDLAVSPSTLDVQFEVALIEDQCFVKQLTEAGLRGDSLAVDSNNDVARLEADPARNRTVLHMMDDHSVAVDLTRESKLRSAANVSWRLNTSAILLACGDAAKLLGVCTIGSDKHQRRNSNNGDELGSDLN